MSIFSSWKQIPRSVNLFFLKVLLVFILWKSVYLIFLLPGRVLDGPLTYSVGVVTTKTLNLFHSSGEFSVKPGVSRIERDGFVSVEEEMDIYLRKSKTLAIADACNGLELFVLYAGFIICFPAPLARKFVYIPMGIGLIYMLNILRCASLTLVYIHYPDYLDFSHHFLFTLIVYGFIFWLWFIFTKKLRFNVSVPK
jgi:exosortase family protein XrtF